VAGVSVDLVVLFLRFFEDSFGISIARPEDPQSQRVHAAQHKSKGPRCTTQAAEHTQADLAAL
jgi:hypothetical protein